MFCFVLFSKLNAKVMPLTLCLVTRVCHSKIFSWNNPQYIKKSFVIKIFQNPKSTLINNACCQYFKELRNLMKTPHISAYIIYNKWIPTTAKINKENSKQSKFNKSCQMKYFIWPDINISFMFSLYGNFLEKLFVLFCSIPKGKGCFSSGYFS